MKRVPKTKAGKKAKVDECVLWIVDHRRLHSGRDDERCKRGHDLTDPRNVYSRKPGYTECRLCRNLAAYRYRERESRRRYAV